MDPKDNPNAIDTSDGRKKKTQEKEERFKDFTSVVQSWDTDKERSDLTEDASKQIPWREPSVVRHKVPVNTDKSIWLAEMQRKGIIKTETLEEQPIFNYVESYVLFFNDKSRISGTFKWLENLMYFLQLVADQQQEIKEAKSPKSKDKLSIVFYLLEIPASTGDGDENVSIKKYVKGELICDDVVAENKGSNNPDASATSGASPKSMIKTESRLENSKHMKVLKAKGAVFKRIEVGLSMPPEIIKSSRCFILEAELPSARLSLEEKQHYSANVYLFQDLMKSLLKTPDSKDKYDFFFIERFERNPSETFRVRIRLYENGRLIKDDVLEEFERYEKLNLLKTEKSLEKDDENIYPRNKAYLEISCPCLKAVDPKENLKIFKGSTNTKRWSCSDCLEYYIYGFNGFLYCLCGKSDINKKLSFRCNEKEHGSSFKQIYGKDMFLYLSELNPIEEINILFLGETGVGKSTFINAFANYSKYNSLQQASDSDLLAVIPSSFTIMDKNMVEKVVKFGDDENEDTEIGASSTQTCRSHVIRYEDKIVQLIDTPGIGDVRGIEVDKKNFENVISFISHFRTLHAICILLKPNNSKLTKVFEFCVKSLLYQLHQSASENIIFVFTNTRGTFYTPGDTYPPLRKLLEGVKNNEPHVDIKLDKDTTYCFDSEAFRFLLASRQNVSFSEGHVRSFKSSWAQGSQETARMMRYVLGRKPHTVQDTRSLCQLRELLKRLTKPLVDVSKNIQENLDVLDDYKMELTAFKENISHLNDKLQVPQIDLNVIPLDKPRTVCTASKCVTVVEINGKQKINYTTICCDPCNLSSVSADVVGNSAIKNCEVMKIGWISTKCKKCGCNWSTHMHIYYDVEQKIVNKINRDVQYELNTEEARLKAKQKAISDSERKRKQLEIELNIIKESIAQLSSFLKGNAITPYNDATLDYIEYLIENEKMKPRKDKKAIQSLKNFKEDCLNEIEILEQAMKTSNAAESKSFTKDLNGIVNKLCDLPLCGNTIKALVNTMENGAVKEHHATAFDSKTFRKSIHREDSSVDNLISRVGKFFSFNPNSTQSFDVDMTSID